jgi:hypothetical protein
MKHSIIFVDIDGPLLPQKMHLFHQNRKSGEANPPMFDPMAVRIFNLWAKYSNAKIVFSTNWAISYSEDELKHIMLVNGLGFDYHDDCITPKRMRSERNHEISEWLNEHKDEVANFIVVDDDYTCKYIEHEGGQWIAVNFANGITYDNFIDGCAALEIQVEDIWEQEFGIKKLTPEQKATRDMLLGAMI